jgi:hypothetical protein
VTEAEVRTARTSTPRDAVAGRGLSCLSCTIPSPRPEEFHRKSPQADDVTPLVLEYRPD